MPELPVFLLVDDDEVFRTRLAKALVKREFNVVEAKSVKEALSITDKHTPDYALIDLSMPGESGLELIAPLQKKFPEVKSVVLTGYGSIVSAVEAMKLGAINYISKPADTDTILAAFDKQQESTPTPTVPSLETVEREHIQRVLHDCEGNISKASRLLGMHRRSLQRKLAKTAD